MPINTDNISILCGNGGFDELPRLKALVPFSDIICAFLNELSSLIMKDAEAKKFPDVMTFGFFCRRANTENLKRSYEDRLAGRIGRGVSFHIAPSNVPVNFAYSMAAALLAGNSCVVRVSEKEFAQVGIICGCISALLSDERFSLLSGYIHIVRYPRDEEINSFFSSLSDIRIIWGGDSTIAEIRKYPLPPRGYDITFADRYSAAVIGAKGYLAAADKKRTAQDFYNDTYLFDQNACSSPRLIYWLGSDEDIAEAKEIFWTELHALLLEKYKVEPVIAVDKYTAACRLAIDKNADIVPSEDNLISRTEIHRLSDDIHDYRCAGGSFIEYSDTSLDALADIITRKYQTVSYIGIDKNELAALIMSKGLRGADRIVPVGKTADFGLVWDGYDLILQMSREISVI